MLFKLNYAVLQTDRKSLIYDLWNRTLDVLNVVNEALKLFSKHE